MFEQAAEIAGRRLAGLRQLLAGRHPPVELTGGQAEAIQVIAPVQAHPHRHDVDAITLRDGSRQVGGAVGQHRELARRFHAALLQQHVVGLHRLDLAEARAGIEQRLRAADVPMHAHPRRAAGDHQRIDVERAQRGLHRHPVDALAQH